MDLDLIIITVFALPCAAFSLARLPVDSDSEVQGFNFAVLDNNGEIAWLHQCSHITCRSIGTVSNRAGRIAQEAASIYWESMDKYTRVGLWMRRSCGLILMRTDCLVGQYKQTRMAF